MKQTNKKILAVVASIGAMIALPIGVMAYYPERQTYTIENPADKITFNSITNNPNYGDERNFTLAKPASHTGAGGWSDTYVNVTDDAEYLVRVYVHNNAAANLNLVAENTRVRVNIPSNTAKEIQLGAFISANNASPREVYDDVIFRSNSKLFNIAYVAGSARYVNNHNPNPGFAISDDLVKGGASVGYDKMDGRVQGCFQYSGILTFKVKVQTQKTPNFIISKQVRKAGTTEWSKKVEVAPGEKVEYQLMYHNKGQTSQDNVVAKDFLPTGVNAIAGSLKIKNAQNPNTTLVNNQEVLFNGNGLNIGSYAPNSNAFMLFAATVPKNEDLKVCGANIFRNRLVVYTKDGNLEDVADVVVKKDNCTPDTPTPNTPENPTPPTPNTPQKPGELPSTGPAEIAISAFGLLLISTSVVYWYKSQKELKKRTVSGNSITMKVETKAPEEQSADKK